MIWAWKGEQLQFNCMAFSMQLKHRLTSVTIHYANMTVHTLISGLSCEKARGL